MEKKLDRLALVNAMWKGSRIEQDLRMRPSIVIKNSTVEQEPDQKYAATYQKRPIAGAGA